MVAIGLHGQPRAVDFRALTLGEVDVTGTMAHVCADDLPESMRLLAALSRSVVGRRPTGDDARPPRRGRDSADGPGPGQADQDTHRPVGR